SSDLTTATPRRGCAFRRRSMASCTWPRSTRMRTSATTTRISRSNASLAAPEPSHRFRAELERPMKHHRFAFLLSLLAPISCLSIASSVHAGTQPTLSPATTPARAGLVDIRSLVPDMAEDIKYAGNDNFVGRPVDGYRAARCYLLRPVAEALARVEHDLRRQHMRLKLFDCYRPARAVADFVR